ncbi:MAG: hypothetical protein Q9219_007338 [cf. Caloplaca sp. 3 TL-2023]
METQPKVTLFLHPRNDKKEFTRSIVFTSFKDPVEIGRASKNPSKGLIAQAGNAWFNSPIMSRQHGRFFMAGKGGRGEVDPPPDDLLAFSNQ